MQTKSVMHFSFLRTVADSTHSVIAQYSMWFMMEGILASLILSFHQTWTKITEVMHTKSVGDSRPEVEWRHVRAKTLACRRLERCYSFSIFHSSNAYFAALSWSITDRQIDNWRSDIIMTLLSWCLSVCKSEDSEHLVNSTLSSVRVRWQHY